MRLSVAQSFSCVWADPDGDHLLCRQQGLPAATDAFPCMLHILLLYCGACSLFVIMWCPEKCGAVYLPVYPRGVACFLQLP